MSIFKRPIILLVVILLIASFLRLYKLGQVPSSLNWDEVSLGYNAKSILETGKDEYGEFLPLVLRSYDDYKPALYVYTAIPFVGVLGLTEIAVRLPSAIAGILAVYIVYFLVQEILNRQKVEILGRGIESKTIALVTCFFLAISPWHIQFSRIAFESNVGLTINLLALTLFLKGLRKPWLLVLSFIFAASNMHMYQSDRVFTPLLFVALSLIFLKELLKLKKWFIASVIAAIVVSLPLVVYILTNQNALLRAKGVSVFSEKQLVLRSSEKLVYDKNTNNYFAMILDNRRVEFVKATIYGYISHFDLNWLFITGDIARHHAPDMGLLYLFELPFILIGFYQFIFLRINIKYKLAFFAYFFLVPIPASITSGVPHAVRTLNFLWTFQLLTAIGFITTFVFIWKLFEEKRKLFYLSLPFSGIFSILIILNFSYYLNQYFVQQNYFNARDWLYGYKEAINYVDSIRENYDQVIVKNEVPFDQSYMFFLFYMNVDPKYYQENGGTYSGGFKEEHKGFYNLTFRPISNVNGKNILLIGERTAMPEKARIIKEIKYPNGESAITVAEL